MSDDDRSPATILAEEQLKALNESTNLDASKESSDRFLELVKQVSENSKRSVHTVAGEQRKGAVRIDNVDEHVLRIIYDTLGYHFAGQACYHLKSLGRGLSRTSKVYFMIAAEAVIRRGPLPDTSDTAVLANHILTPVGAAMQLREALWGSGFFAVDSLFDEPCPKEYVSSLEFEGINELFTQSVGEENNVAYVTNILMLYHRMSLLLLDRKWTTIQEGNRGNSKLDEDKKIALRCARRIDNEPGPKLTGRKLAARVIAEVQRIDGSKHTYSTLNRWFKEAEIR